MDHLAVSGSGAKNRYGAPRLTEFGSVRELTASALSATLTESTTGNGGCANDGNRRNCTLSDPSAKQSVVRVGEHPLGFGLYSYEYKPAFRAEWGHGRQFGVMADEVRAIVPEAIAIGEDGLMRVDYAMLGIVRH